MISKEAWGEIWHLSGKELDDAWQAKQEMHSQSFESHMVIGDIQPYKSMVDGSIIMSRSKHKEHLKQHGMIEIGNEKMPERKEPKYDSDAVKRTIAQQLYR